jgi:hypothetical protein
LPAQIERPQLMTFCLRQSPAPIYFMGYGVLSFKGDIDNGLFEQRLDDVYLHLLLPAQGEVLRLPYVPFA